MVEYKEFTALKILSKIIKKIKFKIRFWQRLNNFI